MTSWDLLILFGPLLGFVTVMAAVFLAGHLLLDRPDL